ncbi:MAG TPA: hypothetical protein VGA73_16415 [Candidatus Binatia bacterium]
MATFFFIRFVGAWRSEIAGELRQAVVGGLCAWAMAAAIFVAAMRVL